MPAADLYLAAGCTAGDAAAITAFRDALLPPLRQALAKLGSPRPRSTRPIQRVLVMLLVGDGRTAADPGLRRARHAAQLGPQRSACAPAGACWVSSTARRPATTSSTAARRGRRSGARAACARATAIRCAARSPRRSPRSTDRQRNVLRQYHIDGLTIDQLAALYQVNRATTARWVVGCAARRRRRRRATS